MPIVRILVVASPATPPPAATVQSLADLLGEVFGTPPGRTWVTVECVPRDRYAENRVAVDASIRPTFVEVLKRTLPGPDALAAEADAVARTVATVLGRPKESTHVLYLPPGEGRVAFGGTLVRG